MDDFRLVMISAMYENGGNTLHRHLDTHPELYVYPFESQLGTMFCIDHLSSLFPYKYRWPEFPNEIQVEDAFELFFDEELKTRVRAPNSSKFRDANIELDEKERKAIFVELMKNKEKERKALVKAFFKSTFEAWKNYNRSGKECVYVGYSPIICVDTPKMIKDFEQIKIIHVVRNPYSAYADTKKRPFPLSLERYTITWNIVQYLALIYSVKFPNNFLIIKYEDFCEDKRKILQKVCNFIGVSNEYSTTTPSWNRKPLEKIYPWGTIVTATKEVNIRTLKELKKDEIKQIRDLCYSHIIKEFGYDTYDTLI
ncbi:MAG: sulfotransferase [Candidatus Anstonellales archaeon]